MRLAERIGIAIVVGWLMVCPAAAWAGMTGTSNQINPLTVTGGGDTCASAAYTLNFTVAGDGIDSGVSTSYTHHAGYQPQLDVWPPTEVGLVSPADGDSILTLAFSWSAAGDSWLGTGVSWYRVEFALDPAFTAIAYSETTANTSLAPVGALGQDTYYWWRVRARDGIGNINTGSETRSFYVVGNNSSGTFPATIYIGDSFGVIIADPDENHDNGVLDTITVIVTNPRTGETEPLVLIETDTNSGVFDITALPTTSDAADSQSASDTMFLLPGDTVMIEYVDPDDGDDSCTNAPGWSSAVPETTTAGGSAPEFTYIGDSIYPTVTDPDQNLNWQVADTLLVIIVNPNTGETETLELIETSPNSGIFDVTALPVTDNPADSPSESDTLCLYPGDTWLLYYYDPTDPSDTWSNDSTGGGTTLPDSTTSSGTFPTSANVGDSIYPTVTDPDQNLDNDVADTVVVVVTNLATGETEVLILLETAPGSGIFDVTGLPTSGLDADSPSSSDTLCLRPGDSWTVTYTDPNDPTDTQQSGNANTANGLPAAAAGSDTVIGLTEIILAGNGSFDPDGDQIAYLWSQVSGPAITIVNAATATASCTDITTGTYVFQLTVTDSWGASGYPDTVVVTIWDSSVPPITAAAVVINADTDYTTSETVTLTITGDTLAVEMMVANDSVFTGGSWEAFATSKTWNLGTGDDTKTVFVKFRNFFWTESAAGDSDQIVLDSLAPETVTVTILEGDTTLAATITLQFGMAGDTTVVQMRVSEFPDYAGAEWEAWDTDGLRSFTLSPGGETKTIYFAVKDAAGNVTQDTAQINYQNMPYPAIGLIGTALGSGNIRLTWTPSPSTDMDTYDIYCDQQTGTIDYGTLAAGIDTGTLAWETGPFPPGQTWKFGLRVRNLNGSEEANTNLVATVTTSSDTGHLYAVIKVLKAGQEVSGNYRLIMAEVYNDTDLGAWVTFEYRAVGDTQWLLVPDAGNDPQSANPDPANPWKAHWNIDLIPNGEYELRAVAWNISETDPYPAAITFTHDDQNPGSTEGKDENDNQKKQELTYAGAEVDCLTGDANGIGGVTIPTGAVTASTSVSVTIYSDTITELNAIPRGRNGFDRGSVVMEASLASGQTTFGDTLTIIIAYQDNNGDSVIDGTRVRLELVQVLYFSVAADTWLAVARGNIRINPDDRVIYALVDHLSKFASGKEHLGGDLGATTSDTVPDGDVDATDLQLFNGAFGASGNYNEDADLITDGVSDGRIDEEDVFEFGRNYGTTQ